MSSHLADVVAAGKALDADEREVAALAFQQTDSTDQSAVDTSWDMEVERRVDDIVSGDAELVDGEATIQMIRAELADRRR